MTAFEPNSENCRLILLSLDRNKFSQVSLIPAALGSRFGSAFFTTALGTNGGIQPTTADQLMSPLCTVIPTLRMDDLPIGRVDFIKMDVEGFEGNVVAGAKETISKYKPIICSEFSPEMLSRVSGVAPSDYLDSIRQMGYTPHVLAKGSETPIEDSGIFVGSYGDPTRISEIAFFPN